MERNRWFLLFNIIMEDGFFPPKYKMNLSRKIQFVMPSFVFHVLRASETEVGWVGLPRVLFLLESNRNYEQIMLRGDLVPLQKGIFFVE